MNIHNTTNKKAVQLWAAFFIIIHLVLPHPFKSIVCP